MVAEGNRLKEDAKIHFDKRTNKFRWRHIARGSCGGASDMTRCPITLTLDLDRIIPRAWRLCMQIS